VRTEDLAGATLLFPDEAAPPVELATVGTLVVLDASWSQAKRMVQRVPVLRALPRLSLRVDAPVKSLRDAPPGGLSTLQAVAQALAMLGDASAAAALERVHERLVARTIAARGYL
jgi:DTW domain-containing protein YfiP